MQRLWRSMGLATGVLTLVAGALLLMGSFRAESGNGSQREQKRVEQLARASEARLEAARSAFRDVLLRHNVGYVVEHPEDWADWRVWQKFALIEREWHRSAGVLRAVLLFTSSGQTHTAWGDTLGAHEADRRLANSLDADMILLRNADGTGAALAMCYRIPPTARSPRPGRIVALLDAASVVDLASELPYDWGLYSTPDFPLLSATNTAGLRTVDATTWPTLSSRWSGTLRTHNKSNLVFSRIRIPGLAPLVLVTAIPTTFAAMTFLAVFLLVVAVTLLYFTIRWHLGESRAKSTSEAALPGQNISFAAVLSSEFPGMPDPQSPYPVMYVTPEGLIQLYNEAALKSCPRMKDTPLISDLLPSLEPRELRKHLEHGQGGTFESLFGSKPYSFTVMPAEDGVLLYAHPLAASQTLEVALRQAHENFNTLCAVSPAPILLVDPRSHAVTEANSSAAEFFGLTPDQLRSRLLDSLSQEPINLGTSDHEFVADVPGGPVKCKSHCEMVKIEGVPMVLVLLQLPREYRQQQARALADTMSTFKREIAEIREVPSGPPVLISLNPVVRDVARRLLEKAGHSAETFSSLTDATGWIFSHDARPEMVVVDVSEFTEAADWLNEVRRRHHGVPCLAITDGVTFGLPDDGPNGYLTKPFDLDSLIDVLLQLGLTTEMPASDDTKILRMTF